MRRYLRTDRADWFETRRAVAEGSSWANAGSFRAARKGADPLRGAAGSAGMAAFLKWFDSRDAPVDPVIRAGIARSANGEVAFGLGGGFGNAVDEVTAQGQGLTQA